MSGARAAGWLCRRRRDVPVTGLLAALLLVGGWGAIGCDPSRGEVGAVTTESPRTVPDHGCLDAASTCGAADADCRRGDPGADRRSGSAGCASRCADNAGCADSTSGHADADCRPVHTRVTGG